jgi:hypothetical protein
MKWMTSILFLAALPTNSSAQITHPYKLIIIRGVNGLSITEYPSSIRCENARIAIQRLISHENEDKKPQISQGGGMIIPLLLDLKSYCIPG